MAIGPIAHYHEISKYYSTVKPRPNKEVDADSPYVTIVIMPLVVSLKKAKQAYVRQGGTPNIFINDDGMRSYDDEDRTMCLALYETHGIG
ncbi:unnamed protein product [Peniophora sp. CBMAI 1063]|nr:unnamed protein product [Peniophora sp. CBMAI 1063]